jgi:4-amino-4-deoxychorismate lyase
MKLLETIRFENGRFANLELHQQRMNASRKVLFNFETAIDLKKELSSRSSVIENTISPGFQIANLKELEGLFKCRIIYSKQIEEIEFIPYQLPKIQFLKMVMDDEINYAHKYFNRNHLNKLFSQKGNSDDILIVKNGLITDTSFANILFFNGKQWLTPSGPLLKGTQRQLLLEREQITTAAIRPADLKYFQKARLINAMIRFEDEVDVAIESIH